MINKTIKFVKDFKYNISKCDLSIVIVTWKAEEEFNVCLSELESQSYKNFEIIIIDNGSMNLDSLKLNNAKYIQLDRNYGLSFARNIGVDYAKSKIVAFLDDDAIPDREWVKSIIGTFRNNKIISLRGKCLPKHDKNIFNYLASHYDLGNKIIPSLIDLEGNSAFIKSEIKKAGGFDPKYFGYEGTDLIYRIIGNRSINLSIYQPNVIIYHDYCDSLKHYLSKSIRHDKNIKNLTKNTPKFVLFQQKFSVYRNNIPSNNYNKLSKYNKLKLEILKLLGNMFRKLSNYF